MGSEMCIRDRGREEFRPFVAETMLLGDPALLLRSVEALSVNVSSQSSSHTSADLLMSTALLAVATVAIVPRMWRRVGSRPSN